MLPCFTLLNIFTLRVRPVLSLNSKQFPQNLYLNRLYIVYITLVNYGKIFMAFWNKVSYMVTILTLILTLINI